MSLFAGQDMYGNWVNPEMATPEQRGQPLPPTGNGAYPLPPQQQGQSSAFGEDPAVAGRTLAEALRQRAANTTPNPNAVQRNPYERGGALYGQPTQEEWEQGRQRFLANQQQGFQATNPFANYQGMGGDNLDNLAMAAGVGGLLGGVPLNQLAAGTLGYEAGNLGIEQARQLPSMLGESAANIANQVGQAAEFRPYTVTTGAGGANYGAQGMTQSLDPNAQAVRDSLMQQAATQAGQLGNVTPEQLMQQMTALRQPEQERQQLGLENRLAAQGRLGVQTAAYGGTPEQLAMQKAIQEQQSADALGAISQARQLQGMDIQNLTGMLGASGIPQQQLTAALQPSLSMMPYAQRAGDLQAQALSNLGQQGMSGMVSAVNSEALLRQAQMESIMNGLGVGQQRAAGGGQTTIQNPLGNLIDQGVDYLGGLFGDYFGATSSQFNNYGSGGFGDAAVDADYEEFLRRLAEGG
jgi:hypothetical protein